MSRMVSVDQMPGSLVFVLVLLVTSAAGSEPKSDATQSADKPNILFLFTDDQRFDTIGALGNPDIHTPALDRLTRSAMTFTNCHVFGSNSPAVCRPSRNMLLSGRSYFRWKGDYAPGDEANLPVTLATAGYQTYHHGKRGNTAVKIQERFDINKYLDDEADRTSGEPGKTIVDEAISFLDTRDQNKPFFMYLAFANPHDPRVAAPVYQERYRGVALPLPKNFLPKHPFDNGELRIRDELLAPFPRTEAEIRRQLTDYYAVITGLDGHIGRLLDHLKASGEDRRTLIVFSSDNGLALGSHGLMGKQNLYEHSAKVPLLIAGPGVSPGRSDALLYLMDLFPTLCELVGVEIPAGLDGMSVAPIFKGMPGAGREDLLLTYRDVQRGIRDSRWKLLCYPNSKNYQLFDLKSDPDERVNYFNDPLQRKRIQSLFTRLGELQKKFGDPLVVPGP
ncbi:MAG: sulfatase-like hydrolase/transferase [Planctomycetota bacterium]